MLVFCYSCSGRKFSMFASILCNSPGNTGYRLDKDKLESKNAWSVPKICLENLGEFCN